MWKNMYTNVTRKKHASSSSFVTYLWNELLYSNHENTDKKKYTLQLEHEAFQRHEWLIDM
jgi:hypothetical protein